MLDMAEKQKLTSLPEKLRNLIELRKTTQYAVANQAGIKPQTFSAYLEGSSPRVDIAIRIAEALRVDFHWLFNEDEPWRETPPAPGAHMTADKLLWAVVHRHREDMTAISAALDKAESMPWSDFNSALEDAGGLMQLPSPAAEGVEVLRCIIDCLLSARLTYIHFLHIDAGMDVAGELKPSQDTSRPLTITHLLSRVDKLLAQIQEGSARLQLARISPRTTQVSVHAPDSVVTFGSAPRLQDQIDFLKKSIDRYIEAGGTFTDDNKAK